ncbi:hypothetical protein C8F04DRAFT_1258506 [Mycena alexandri]|uniref:F-box domain-containing protein n=1 Tax=Mycena alexandri TaxID=1745969 RepID=A0AAD6SXZ8_9AGAR|nr:hypothetical protein C8F04DRAFT_1258506 [Mycena alexandri]
MNGFLAAIWFSWLVGVCICADGSRRIQDAALVSNAVGFARSGAGAAALSIGGALRFTGSTPVGTPSSRSLLQLLSPELGVAFAGAFAPALADVGFPVLSSFLHCPGPDVGSDAFVANGVFGSAVPLSEHYELEPVQTADSRLTQPAHADACSPRVGRAGRTSPFIGTVCGILILVWIEQSASLGLPNEILYKIFTDTAGPYDDTEPARHEHYQSLFSLAGTCRHWNDFLGGCGGLWSSFRLTPHRLTASLDFWLSRIHNAPLDLTLSFDDLFALYHPRSTARAPRLGVRGTIIRVAPALSSCAHLSVDAEAITAFPLLMQALGIASGHILVSLSITRVYFAFLEDLVPPFDPAPNLFFRTGVPMLRFLRLCNATVGWDNIQFFLRLEVLKLWGFRRPISPTAVQLYAILAVTRYLVRLSLREVECDALPPRDRDFIAWPHLVELDLHLSGTLGVPEVLSRCRFTVLRKLSLILDTEFDVRCLLACSAMLGRIVVLTLQVDGVSREVLSELWSSLPLVEDADLSSSGLVAFEALHSPDGPYDSSNLCPRLANLSVSGVMPSVMRRFLERRAASHVFLRRLVMYQVVDFFEAGEADLDWIAAFLDGDSFFMDPDLAPDFSMRWLNH